MMQFSEDCFRQSAYMRDLARRSPQAPALLKSASALDVATAALLAQPPTIPRLAYMRIASAALNLWRDAMHEHLMASKFLPPEAVKEPSIITAEDQELFDRLSVFATTLDEFLNSPAAEQFEQWRDDHEEKDGGL
jgi:hypothetical protein